MRGAVLRKVMLNHAARQGKQSMTAMVVLGLGVASICMALYQLQLLHTHNQTLEAEIEHIQHPQASRPNKPLAAKRGEKNEEMAVAAEIKQQLALPWEPLFAAIERITTQNTTGSQIRILAVEPNPVKHKLRLTAEANNVASMLEYVKLLSEQTMLKEVLLQTHEQAQDGRAMPISFVVEAIWQF